MKLTEIAVYYRNFNENNSGLLRSNEVEVINLLKLLINSVVLKSRFYDKGMYRINLDIHPRTDLKFFKEDDVNQIRNTYRKDFQNIGTLMTFIDIEQIIRIADKLKRLSYLSSWIKIVLKDFLEYNGIDSSKLIQAFDIIEKNDFYTDASQRYFNKKKNVEIWIERKIYYPDFIFRIMFFNLNTQMLQQISIPEKNRSESEKISPYVSNYTPHGWKKGNIFHLSWGDEEKYEFQGDSMQLFKNGELVNPT